MIHILSSRFREASVAPDAPGERGFTLIEVVIALVILMIVSIGVVPLFFYSITNNSGANDRAITLAVAQRELEKLRDTPFASIATTNATGTTSTVTSAGRSYTVVSVVCGDATCDPNSSATLRTIRMTVTPQGAGPGWVRTPVTVVTQRSSLLIGAN